MDCRGSRTVPDRGAAYGDEMDRDKFYVTTPIYYVNDKPHIGHAYTTILADVLSRYHRLLGIPTFFLTGTDEHGQKVQRAAEKEGITPQEQADSTVTRFQELWKKLCITNDDFIRTTEDRHKKVVQAVLQDLYDRDDIYKASYDGWYCVTCERFFAEKDLVDDKCPEPGCGRQVERITETNYFFRMSKYQDWLIDYINKNPKFIQPDFRRNETLGFLRKELNDLCISRPKTRLSWGIELPFDADYVTYVWFDALLNYVTAVGYGQDDELFAKWWPASYHLIGKDILTTHTVYWPTMLKAMGVEMPETVFAHGWWLIGDSKMSKSQGNVVNPMDMAEKYGVDVFRYYLVAEMTLGQDASFSEESFVRTYNDCLANDLGNFLSRTLKLVKSSCNGVIPQPGELSEDDRQLSDVAVTAVCAVEDAIENMRLDHAMGNAAALMREANRYFDHEEPWKLAREKNTDRLNTVLYNSCEILRIVSGLLYPTMPEKMMALREALGLPGEEPSITGLRSWGGMKPGIATGKQISLFPRLTFKKSEPPKEPPPGIKYVEYDDFMRTELRTARILSAEKVKGADKLLRLQIDVGEEKRQLVAGLALHYSPDELVGKTIVVVANLKPAKIRGVESQGMLLAACSGDVMRVLTVDGDIPPGAKIR